MTKILRAWFTCGFTGLVVGISFALIVRVLSLDGTFELWEFAIAMIVPGIIAIIVRFATGSSILVLLIISYLTCVIPVLGPLFGGSGNEPLWAFGMLGLVGGLVWYVPFAMWRLLMRS